MSQKNVQPFYHSASVLFTGVGHSLTEGQFKALLEKALGRHYVDVDIEEWLDPEPGDPADLL